MLNLSDADLWASSLQPGEDLLWTGRPDTGFRLSRNEWALMAFIAACLIGVSVFALASDAMHDAPPWVIAYMAALGILGLALVPLRLLRVRAQRRNLRYALTDQRALTMRSMHQDRLHAYPFSEMNCLKLSDYSDGLSILIFKEESMARQVVEIGFEFIPDGQAVHDRMKAMSVGKQD